MRICPGAATLGVNYKQIPVSRPGIPAHNYSKDGVPRIQNVPELALQRAFEYWRKIR